MLLPINRINFILLISLYAYAVKISDTEILFNLTYSSYTL
jgi:hypothetical protein